MDAKRKRSSILGFCFKIYVQDTEVRSRKSSVAIVCRYRPAFHVKLQSYADVFAVEWPWPSFLMIVYDFRIDSKTWLSLLVPFVIIEVPPL